jgi:thioredoxin 2
MSALTLDDRGVVVPCPSCQARNRRRYAAVDRTTRCAHCHAMLPQPSAPIDVRGTSIFDSLVAEAAVPVLVDFWAPWCGPCRAMAPELERAALQLAGRALVVKVDTDAEAELGERFRIRSIPTLALFRGGRELRRVAGARSAADIVALIDSSATSPLG